jgi:putative spermidine/putrescine transport system ATP-binding protein
MSDRVAVFREGEIAQLDTPEALYEAPRSAFVARFVGESNMLAGMVETTDGGECRLRLPDGASMLARPVETLSPGTRAVIAFRPERARLADGNGPANRLPGKVVEAIYHGDHVRLRVAVGGETATVKLPAGTVPAGLHSGADATIWVRPEDCRALAAID